MDHYRCLIPGVSSSLSLTASGYENFKNLLDHYRCLMPGVSSSLSTHTGFSGRARARVVQKGQQLDPGFRPGNIKTPPDEQEKQNGGPPFIWLLPFDDL